MRRYRQHLLGRHGRGTDMETDENAGFAPRIGSIQTRWSLIRRAHGDRESNVIDARRLLVLRYSPAIRGYVRAMTRSEEEADEISQDAVVRLLKGDFAGADPNRGRFRDLLKTAIRNMVRNYWQRKSSRKSVAYDVDLTADPSQTEQYDPWENQWQRTLLDLAMSQLEEYQRQNPQSLAHTLLSLRTAYPDASSQQLARLVEEKTGHELRADTLRQKLRRARVRFAELLIQEIADGLDEPTADRVEDELLALGLWDQIRDVLPHDWRARRQ